MMTAEKIVESLLDEPEMPDPKKMAIQALDKDAARVADERSRGIVNPSTVKQYGYIFHRTAKKRDGTACAAKVTSIRTWKRDPNRWEIGWKYGMYEYGTVTPQNAAEWTTIEPEQVKPEKRRR